MTTIDEAYQGFALAFIDWLEHRTALSADDMKMVRSYQALAQAFTSRAAEATGVEVIDPACIDRGAPDLAFEVRTDSKVYQIFTSGRVRGFDGDGRVLVFNRIPILLAQL